ncbi:MAG: anaerobic ribonucleoside-triphosphate reductase, partial [Promethearchaeota archaeon]
IELDTLRTGNLDTIFINLPRIAYEAKQDDDKFFENLSNKVNLAISALKIKRNEIHSRLFEDRLLPLLNFRFKDESYFRLEHATNALSYVGLPEATEIHTNTKISTKNGIKFAQNIIQHLHEILIKTTDSTGFRWLLRQSPSQYWIERFIQLDNKRFHRNKKIESVKQFQFYNTSNINSDISLPISEKIRVESHYHKFLSGGHIMTIPISETSNSVDSLKKLTNKICNESIGLFTYAHDLTYCIQCKQTVKGIPKRCSVCNTTQNIAYFNKLQSCYRSFKNLSKSERFEIRNRYKFTI